MGKKTLLGCFCCSFVAVELCVLFGVLAYNPGSLNLTDCIEYNCTYTPKRNPNGKEDCWAQISDNRNNVNNMNGSESYGCFLGKPQCPNQPECYIIAGSMYLCPVDRCDSISLQMSLWMLSVFFGICFLVSVSVTVYKFNRTLNKLKMYQMMND